MKGLSRQPAFRVLGVGFLAVILIVSCATVAERQPYVDSNAPHAILDFSRPPPGGELTPARLFAVDNVVGPASATRLSYWVTPGTHVVTVYGQGLAREKVGIPARGHNDPGKLEMNFEAGRRYYIAILWGSNQRNDWHPTVWRVE